MKAVRFHRHGGPDVLVYEEAPEPQLAPGEVPHKQDISEEIDRLTNRRGVDVVLEHVGEATWKALRKSSIGSRLRCVPFNAGVPASSVPSPSSASCWP